MTPSDTAVPPHLAATPPPPLEPWDRWNRELAANVHPPGWHNPEPRDRYHLVVLGAGTGGLVTAAIAAALGARVALVERHLMGGDCLNSGCVPSKALLRAARAWREARTAAERFGGPAVSGEGDFAAVMERMRRLRAEISPADSAERFRGMGVDVFLGEGRFVSPGALRVGDATLRFRRAVVATGGRPAVPPVPGLAEAGFLTTETLWSLTERPARMAVVGAGPVGCEMAQAFARFGTEVTLLDMCDRVLPREDPDASDVLLRALEADGVRWVPGATLTEVEVDGTARVVRWTGGDGGGDGDGGDRGEAEVDAILVAAGRTPNVEGMGLEAAGVDFDPSEGIRVDGRLRTSSSSIFAVGDVADRTPNLTHAADAAARLVVRNALFWGRGKVDDLAIPRCTYTEPEVAHVGIGADAAGRDGVRTVTVPMDDNDRARLDGTPEGFVRIHVEDGGRILGATVVADHAGDLVAQVAQAMTAGTKLGTVGETVFPYPTQADAIRRAADAWGRGRLTPTVAKLFAAFFRWVR